MGREDNLTKFDHLCLAKKPKNMNTDPKQVKTVNSAKLHWAFKGSLDARGVPWAPKEVPLAPEEILLSCLQRYKGLLGFGFSQFISYAKLHLKTQKLLGVRLTCGATCISDGVINMVITGQGTL